MNKVRGNSNLFSDSCIFSLNFEIVLNVILMAIDGKKSNYIWKTVFNQYLENEDMDPNNIKNNFQSIFGCCRHVQMSVLNAYRAHSEYFFFHFLQTFKDWNHDLWIFLWKNWSYLLTILCTLLIWCLNYRDFDDIQQVDVI